MPVWLLPHLLSLDAPVVALVWQALLAKTTGTDLEWADRTALGLSAWLIYLVDRLLDVRVGPGPATARHRFYRTYGSWCLGLAGLVAAADVAVIGCCLNPAVVRTGLLVLGVVLVYLAAVHWAGVKGGGWKEGTVAGLFTAGTFVAVWARFGLARPEFPGSFFILCFLNLVLIAGWEDEATGLVRLVWRGYGGFVFVFIVYCLAASGGIWARATGSSAAALLALRLGGGRLSPDTRRALADIALLTPVWFLL